MKKIYKLILSLLFCFHFLYAPPPANYQDIEPLNQELLAKFEFKEFFFHFKDKTYKIFLAQSKNFSLKTQAKAFYMLDANKQFPLFLNALSEKEPKANFIIIGIGYDTKLGYDKVQRTRDYTPKIKIIPEEFKEGGKEEEFFEFLSQNLIPKIQALYPNIKEKALFGHSFGGLFTLNALLKHPMIFQSYFITSASLWWGEGSFLPQYFKLDKCPQILIMQGELEAQRGKSPLSLEQLSLKLQKESACKVEFKKFKDKNHGSVIKSALLFAYEHF